MSAWDVGPRVAKYACLHSAATVQPTNVFLIFLDEFALRVYRFSCGAFGSDVGKDLQEMHLFIDFNFFEGRSLTVRPNNALRNA